MTLDVFMQYLPAISSFIATIGGILLSNKLMIYRIEQLEKKVEKHNNVIDRTYKLELKDAVHDEKFKDLAYKVSSLEKGD